MTARMSHPTPVAMIASWETIGLSLQKVGSAKAGIDASANGQGAMGLFGYAARITKIRNAPT